MYLNYSNVDYRLRVTWIIHQQLWGYKVEEELYLGGGGFTEKIEYHTYSEYRTTDRVQIQ
jgi:hypothetical protein